VEVTIYVLGDMGTFRAVLQSVAMLFADPILSNNGALGIGSAAGLGLLITLLWVVANGVLAPTGQGRGFNPAIVFILLVTYFALAVPKARVQLEDIYTGNVTAVDGVPIGIAYPGAVISAITRNITSKVETAFSGVDGNYISLSAQGYASPLRLLLAMRKGVANFDPYLEANLKTFIVDCVVGSPTFKQGDFAKSQNAVGYITTNYRDGLSVYYSQANPQGVASACAESAPLIAAAADNFVVGTPMTRLLNANITVRATPNTATANQWTSPDVEMVHTNTVTTAFGAAQSAMEFMENALFAGILTDAYNCAGASTDIQAMRQCTLTLTQASEQWKTDAAGTASFFQKTMIPSMNILLLLFYAFAPLMFVFMMMAGWHGLSVLTKYLIFGVWTQTWLPFAAIINYIIQVQTVDELRRVAVASTDAAGKALTPAVLNPFYEVLSTKLATASEMLAATPLITLALMTGSIYGLVGMAQRMSGRDYVNEKQASPDLHQPAPVSMGKPQYSGIGGRAVGDMAQNPGWSGSLGNVRGHALESARGEVESASRQLTEQSMKMLKAGSSQGVNVKSATQHMNEIGVTRGASFQAMEEKFAQAGRDMGMSAEQSKEFGRQAAVAASVGVQTPFAGMKGEFKAHGKDVSSDKLQQMYKEAIGDGVTRQHTEQVQRQIAEKTTDTKGFEKLFGRTLSSEETQGWQEAKTRQQQTQDSFRAMETASSSFNGSNTIGGEQIANAMKEDRGHVRGDLVKAERLMGDAIGDDKWQGFMNRAEGYVRTSQYESTLMGGERQDAIRFHALRMASQSGDRAARSVADGHFLGAVARIAGESTEAAARIAQIQPSPLWLNVQGPSAETEFKAVSAGSAAEALAGGTQEKVDAAIAKAGLQGTKAAAPGYNVKYNKGIDAVEKRANSMEKLNSLKGAEDRDQMRQEVNAGSMGGLTAEELLGKDGAETVRKYTGLSGRDEESVERGSVLPPGKR
jgi:conjugal transfer mating pair stabilization protein TraG